MSCEIKGIKSFGSYFPRYFHVVNQNAGTLTQRIAHPYEDVATMSIHAGQEAIEQLAKREGKTVEEIKDQIIDVRFASEDSLYAVKATSITIAGQLGLNKFIKTADIKNACASGFGTIIDAHEQSSHSRYKGKDIMVFTGGCSRIKKGNEFYNLVGHGATAFIIGENPLIEISDEISAYSIDENGFFVPLEERNNPVCNGKKSIYDYKKAVYECANNYLMNNPFDYDYVILHTPVPKIIKWITWKERNGFENNTFKHLTEEQVREKFKYNSITKRIGNTFAPNMLFNLINWIEHAIKGEEILGIGYGSGDTALTAKLTAKEDTKDCPGIKLEDKLVTDPRFALNNLLFDSYMDNRIEPQEFKGNEFTIGELYNATLIKFDKENSLIQLNDGREVTIEVVGCSKLESGTILEPTYKHIKQPNGKIEHKFIGREKLHD